MGPCGGGPWAGAGFPGPKSHRLTQCFAVSGKKTVKVTDRKWGVKQLKLPLGEILVNGKSSGPSRKATPTLCVSLMNRTRIQLGKHQTFVHSLVVVPWQTQPVGGSPTATHNSQPASL